jgi:hypothetical protein
MLLIPVANIRQRAFFAAGRAPDADPLAVPEQRDVKIEQQVRLVWQDIQEQEVSLVRSYLWTDQPNPLADPVNVGVDR